MKRLLQASFLSFVVRSFGHVTRILVGILLARLLGASSYGFYSYVITIIAVASIPAIVGMDHTILRFVPKYVEKKQYGNLKGIIKFSHIAVALALIPIVAVLSLLSKSYPNHSAVLLMILTLPLIILGQLRQSVVRSLHFPVLAQIPENIIYPGAILLATTVWVFFLNGSLNLWDAAVINITAWLISFVIGQMIFFKVMRPFKCQTTVDMKPKQWIAPATGLIFSGLAFILLSKAELLVLGYYRTSTEVGVYTAAVRGAELVQFAYEAVCLGGAALFSRIYEEGDTRKIQEFVSNMTAIVLWTTLPVYLGLYIFSWELLNIFGEEYVEAVKAFRILITFFYLSSLSGFIIIMLYVAGYQAIVAKAMWGFACCNILLSKILIARYGIEGAAFSAGISLLLLKIYLVYFYYKKTGILSIPKLITERFVRVSQI